MTVNVIGAAPRPWVFTIGVDLTWKLAQELNRLVPTLTAIDDLSQLRQVDYDAAVVVGDGAIDGLEDHIQVVWFSDHGTAPVRRAETAAPYTTTQTYWEDGDRASRFVTTEVAAGLSVASLAAKLAPTTDNDYRVMLRTNWLAEQRHALLAEVGGKQGALAAVYDRNKEKTSEVWCLPERALADGGTWVKAALEHWRDRFPEPFPFLSADWAADETWMSADEQTARLELRRHDTETAALLEARRLERAEREVAAEQARVHADAGIRRLITTNGEPLVEAVADALRQLGFEVVDSDQVLPAGQKREDLLIRDESWVSVTEVKGYEKGNAKQNDLLQLGSAVESYLLRTSRAPDARWYVVNQNFRTPPGLRQRALAGAGDTVTKFTAQNGLVLDTRDLFRLIRAVSSGEVDAAEARRQLRDARGVFDYPAQTVGEE